MKFPDVATARIVLPVLHHYKVPAVDIVCTRGFVSALCGDSRYEKETYYLEWHQQTTLVIVHIANQKVRPRNTAGHRTERCVTERNDDRNLEFHSVSVVRIDNRRVAIACEIDAVDDTPYPDHIVEIKSSTTKHVDQMLGWSEAVQILCNGACSVACCSLDADAHSVTAWKLISREEALHRGGGRFLEAGQRVRMLLHQIVDQNEVVQQAKVGGVVKLTFDRWKGPTMKIVTGVTILPADMPAMPKEKGGK
eukprot:GEMP01063372.1.p1 GENE.GEMP01063372.1~~GEMP01063372.1.p1  ORF type:complete len:251 (+),score=51.52 GEMP01063372.1:80-832(+)